VGFESVLEIGAAEAEFGKARYIVCGKERPHISRAKLIASDNTEFVGLGEHKLVVYKEWMGKRYVAAEGLTYDFILTLYDVNAPKISILRLFETKELERDLKKGLQSVMTSRPNIEARVFGLQNGEEHAFLKKVIGFMKKEGVRVIEIDLFGEEMRNIAIDLKTGASYNVLMEDRNYRPGELINRLTPDDFKRTLLKAKS
jgi:hypothetical protein